MTQILYLQLAHAAIMSLGRALATLSPNAVAMLGDIALAALRISAAEYHVSGFMILPFLLRHSSTILALAALACGALGVSIFARTKRTTDIVVLELMIAAITGYFMLLAVADSLPFSLIHAGAETHRAGYILKMSAEMLRIAFFVFGGHFLAITHQRTVSSRQSKLEDPDLNRLWIAFAYLCGGGAMADAASSLWTNLHTYQTWTLAAPPLPHSFGWSFFNGFATSVWLIIQFQILLNIYSQVPDEKRQASKMAQWHLANAANRQIIGLHLAERPTEERLSGAIYKPDEWRAFLVLMVGTIAGMILTALEHRFRMWGADYYALWTLKMQLLPLVILFPLVYYKTRFLFFDVIIKRGVLALALLATSGVLITVLPKDLPEVLIWAISAGFIVFWTSLRHRLNRALDQYLFHRPDYDVLQLAIGEELRVFDDAHSTIDHVTTRLREALRVDFVRFAEQPSTDDASFPVPNHGHLVLGSRPRSQPYQSADIHFLTAIAARLALTLDLIAQKTRETELRELAVRAELKALRAQINPHFFFNALNTVADLTQSNPAAAEKTILNLARIFQFALEATRQDTISLGREVAFVRSYLEIEKARFEEKLNYAIDIPDALGDVPIPPMLIQPLVENAVRHGISPKTGAGCVTVRARLDDDRLWISVEDDGVGFETTRAAGSDGVGLSNVADRVGKLAGHWQVESTPGVGTSVRFDLEVERCAS